MMATKVKHKKSRVVKVTAAGEGHQVVSVVGGNGSYRKKPCGGCPWRVDKTGEFPREAFEVSANTAYDMSEHMFSCHESGTGKPATCAGFLCNGSQHNLSFRMACMTGRIKDDFSDGGLELHKNYRAMAIANGVDPNAASLKKCRD